MNIENVLKEDTLFHKSKSTENCERKIIKELSWQVKLSIQRKEKKNNK